MRAELDRLANGMDIGFADSSDLNGLLDRERTLVIAGEGLANTAHIREAIEQGAATCGCMAFAGKGDTGVMDRLDPPHGIADLEGAVRRIVTATAKPGDGIVSRYVNRPISQTVSRFLLRWPAVRPIHATIVTGVLAIVMFLCLIAGGNAGLIAGALLFQAASIIDGVDGEIARATYRTSDFGAFADSLIDAVTNIAFIAGVVINLWI